LGVQVCDQFCRTKGDQFCRTRPDQFCRTTRDQLPRAITIEQAIADGVDILNMSMSTTTAKCELNGGGLAGYMLTARQAGMLVVVSAGNDGWLWNEGTYNPNCNVNSFASLRSH